MEQKGNIEEAKAEEFRGGDVLFTVHRKPKCMVEFAVEAQEELVQKARRAALKKVGKQVSHPGFRKGKVPEQVLLKSYPEEIDKEWQHEIATLAFQECEKLANIPVLHREAKISFECKSHSEKGAVLTLSFETEPEVPMVDPKVIELKKHTRPEVNEEKVKETIRQTQFFFAKWETVEGRAVEQGDFVLLDLDVIEEDGSSKPLFSHTRFEVVEKSMAQWMRSLLLGMNVGDVKEGVSVPDQDEKLHGQEDLQPKKVRIKLIAIEKAELPPVDDAFAQKLGISTVKALQTRIAELLNKQADAHVREDLRQQISEALLAKFPFELPQTLVHKEAEFRLRQISQEPDFVKYWKGLSEEKQKELIETIYQQSEKAVKIFYLCKKIVDEANISITPSDVPAAPDEPLELLLGMRRHHHHMRNPEVEHAEAFARLVLEKAEDYIIERATEVA